MPAAIVLACRSSHSRAPVSTRRVGSGASASITSATVRGSSDTSANPAHSATYWPALGFVSEMSFTASRISAPGLASAAPAPTIAITGEEATLLI